MFLPFLRLLQNVRRLVLGFMVGADDQLRHQADQDELHPDQKADDGEQENGVAVGLHRLEVLLVEDEQAQQPGADEGDEPESAEKIHRLGGVASQKLDGDQIEQDLDGTPDPVLGFSVKTRVVPDGNLRDFGARPGGEDGYEAVHFPVKTHVRENLRSIPLQCAPVVAKRHAADPADQEVGQPGREHAGQPGVLPVLPPAADDVIPLLELLDDSGNVARIVLQIGVERNNDPPPGPFEAGGQSRGLAEVPNEFQQVNPLVRPGQLLQLFDASVETAVIDEQNLAPGAPGAQDFFQRFIQRLQAFPFVEDGNYDGKFGRGVSCPSDWR